MKTNLTGAEGGFGLRGMAGPREVVNVDVREEIANRIETEMERRAISLDFLIFKKHTPLNFLERNPLDKTLKKFR